MQPWQTTSYISLCSAIVSLNTANSSHQTKFSFINKKTNKKETKINKFVPTIEQESELWTFQGTLSHHRTGCQRRTWTCHSSNYLSQPPPPRWFPHWPDVLSTLELPDLRSATCIFTHIFSSFKNIFKLFSGSCDRQDSCRFFHCFLCGHCMLLSAWIDSLQNGGRSETGGHLEPGPCTICP